MLFIFVYIGIRFSTIIAMLFPTHVRKGGGGGRHHCNHVETACYYY